MKTSPQNNLSEMVVSRMLKLMHQGKLQPGESISLRTMAPVFGVSTLPAAIGFKKLENAGLLITKKCSGTRIATLSPAEVWDFIQLRLAVEEKAAELACRYAAEEDFAALEKCAGDADLAQDFEQEACCDDQFHLCLAKISKSYSIYNHLAESLPFFWARSALCPEIAAVAHKLRKESCIAPGLVITKRGHLKIAAAICRRDAAEAKKLLADHICCDQVSSLLN